MAHVESKYRKILAQKSRLRLIVIFLFGLFLCLCSSAAGQSNEEGSRPQLDDSLSRYRGINTSQPDLTMISRKFSSQEVIRAMSASGGYATRIYPEPTSPQRFADRKFDFQDLMEHLPLAGPTIQMVTTTADAHPQVTRIVRFLTKHVDPQF